MTLCRDCAHIRPSDNFALVAAYAKCAADKFTCPVDGHEATRKCFESRGAHGACGPDARLFEPKTPAPLTVA